MGFGGGFLWGDEVPPRPPKCALMGAFHEVVRLGAVWLEEKIQKGTESLKNDVCFLGGW